jgi:hypothetical protein
MTELFTQSNIGRAILQRLTNLEQTPLGGTFPGNVTVGGTFYAAGVASFGDMNFTVQINTTNPLIGFDAGDYLAYDRTANIFAFNIASAPIFQITAVGVALAGVLQVSAHAEIVDNRFTLGIAGGTQPQIAFDTNDYFLYDRTANKLYLYIGATAVMSIDASGNMRLKGTLTQSTTP